MALTINIGNNYNLPKLRWRYQSSILSSSGFDELAYIDYIDGNLPPLSQKVGCSWSADSISGIPLAIVADANFRSGKALESIYPTSDGLLAWTALNFASLGVTEIYIQFKAAMIGPPGSCKFCKIFGINDADSSGDGDYANTTLQPVSSPGGEIQQLGFGDGTLVTNDVNNSASFNGTSYLGRAPSPTIVSPQASFFNSWENGKANQFRFRAKFNTGTTAGNEVADGEYDVWINGNKYLEVRGLFNRHYTNGAIERVGFFDWAQANPDILTLRYSDIIISTGGFA